MKVAICDYARETCARSNRVRAARRLGRRRGDERRFAVLPGVGAAAPPWRAGRARPTQRCERHAAGRAVLGICLGLQLALEWTDEDGGVEELGLAARPCAPPRGGPCAAHGLGGRSTAQAARSLRALVRRSHARAPLPGRRCSWRSSRSGSFVGCRVPSAGERRWGPRVLRRRAREVAIPLPPPDSVPGRRGRPRRQGHLASSRSMRQT